MTELWHISLLFLASYLIGSIPFGVIVASLRGTDIRQAGSGNIGATNVGRILGPRWGLLVLLLDVAKGALTSIGANLFLMGEGTPLSGLETPHRDLIWLGTGICCVVGNIAPIYLRFKGGKGVATTLGVILGIYPFLTIPAVIAIVVWAVVVKITQFVSLGSLTAACFLPFGFVIVSAIRHWPLKDHYPLLGLTCLVAVVIVFRHLSNIGRLLAGTENKLGDKPK